MKPRKVMPLIAVLLFASFACGDNDDGATTTEPPTVTDTADEGAGAGGTTDDSSPGPVGSPGTTPAGTADGPDTGGGAIYDQTPSVEPPAS